MPNLRIPFERAVPRRRILGPASSMVICLLSSVSKGKKIKILLKIRMTLPSEDKSARKVSSTSITKRRGKAPATSTPTLSGHVEGMVMVPCEALLFNRPFSAFLETASARWLSAARPAYGQLRRERGVTDERVLVLWIVLPMVWSVCVP